MTMHGRSRSLRSIFGRKKSTYGLMLPEEFFQPTQNNRKLSKKKSTTDCFVPTKMDNWELPQYESLFQHLIVAQDESYRRRLSSTASSYCHSSESEDKSEGPLKAIQKWFKEIIHSLNGSGEYDLGGDNAVEGIPIDVCEKLRHVHIYY